MQCIMDLIDIGQMEYDAALDIQLKLHEQCCLKLRPDALLLQQNPPVITLGRDAKPEHLLWNGRQLDEAGIAVRNVMRGGDITYHGPGQFIASPIIHFREYTSTVLGYLRMLEQIVMDLLGSYGIEACRMEDKSGVWVGGEKIAAVGLHVSRSVTMHGIALNICPDMGHFEAIIPCGLVGMGVTSLHKLGIDVTYEQVKAGWLHCFSNVFNICFTTIKEVDLFG